MLKDYKDVVSYHLIAPGFNRGRVSSAVSEFRRNDT